MNRLLLRRRGFLAAAASVPLLASLSNEVWASSSSFTPEQFGAKGDGTTNDSLAFNRLAAAVNAAGGGTVALRPTTYRVGGQTTTDKKGRVVTLPLLVFVGCQNRVAVLGNGARIQCVPGLRFGAFDWQGNAISKTDQKDMKAWHQASAPPDHQWHIERPYASMVEARECTGPVEIRDLELDGQLQNLVIGGKSGDKGWQIATVGLRLSDNTGSETVDNIYTHHHALDGLYIDGVDSDRATSRSAISNVRSEFNARQGASVVGGRDYGFVNCTFAHTGRSNISSAPAAGVDLEAERHKKVQRISFDACRFFDNVGAGLLASTGDVSDVDTRHSVLIGTTSYSAWPNKPKMRFRDCLFVGTLVNAHGDADENAAARFDDCVFRDSPALSPTGQVFLVHNLCAQLPFSRNALFNRCQFLLDDQGVLPWSTPVVRYQNCLMRQASSNVAHTRGVYYGTTRITGHVDLAGSHIVGRVILNGKLIESKAERDADSG